jgi:Tfp pilus assembly protein PilX
VNASAERDRGAILVVTLVLCMVLGITVVALARFATTGLKTSAVTDHRNEQVTALDAGLRVGLEIIETNATACLTPYLVPQSINGVNVTVRCEQISPLLSTTWMTYRITSTISGSARTGVAIVQASTSSGAACLPLLSSLVQIPACQLTVNSWAIA